jgi:hypothetical protein
MTQPPPDGGSYRRLPDGSLVRLSPTTAAAPGPARGTPPIPERPAADPPAAALPTPTQQPRRRTRGAKE